MASPSPPKRKSLAQILADVQSTPASKKRKAQVSSPKKKKLAPCAQQQDLHSAKACGLLAKLIDGGVVCDHEPVYYRRKRDKSVLKEGQLTREGVICGCCGHLFLLSKFEAHAGSGLHRPSANIFLKDGRSILQCQQDVENGDSCMCPSDLEDVSDDICQICGDGGHLMLCDSCPSVFHADCLHLDAIPKGDWHCPTCRCGLCGLGKSHDSSICMMISCAQCQVSYHRSCVLDALEQAEEPWLCSKMCRDIFHRLRDMVGRVFLLDRGLSWMLIRSPAEDPVPALQLQHDTSLGTGALKLLQQCFNPIVDHQTGIDVLSQMVFNRKSHDVRRLDCSGFYTMLLMKGKQLVSVATIRAHGNVLAEMPFIGTSHEFRKQGMCKVLMQALETMLREAGVYKLLIPSISEMVDTWKGSFGFKSISRQDQKQLSGANLLSFPGTTLLYKSLRQKPVVSHIKVIASASSSLTKLKGRLKHTKKACSSLQPISCH